MIKALSDDSFDVVYHKNKVCYVLFTLLAYTVFFPLLHTIQFAANIIWRQFDSPKLSLRIIGIGFVKVRLLSILKGFGMLFGNLRGR
jgi:hypothetical protein